MTFTAIRPDFGFQVPVLPSMTGLTGVDAGRKLTSEPA